MKLVVYIVGHKVYVHVRDACSISRSQVFVPVEFRLYLGVGVRSSEKLG